MTDNKNIRVNLSVSPEIDRIVQNTRAKYLSQETPVDLSYTDVICMFVELGDTVLRSVASGDQDIKTQIYRMVDEKIIKQYVT